MLEFLSNIGVGLLLVLVAVTIGAIFYDRLVLRARARKFSHRKRLSEAEIHARYYAHSDFSPAELAAVWSVVARIVLIDPQLMRPTDRFEIELAPTIWTDSSDSETSDLFMYLGLACDQSELRWDPTTVVTIDDAVELLCQCQRIKGLPNPDAVR